MSENNPLKLYFRKPGIWIKLPSAGKFYKEAPADFNDMGEIPVYPMTAKDELIMKKNLRVAQGLLGKHRH